MSARDLDDIYAEVHKYYKTITREMVREVVNKFNDIVDVWLDFMNYKPKDREQAEHAIVVRRILAEPPPYEACSFDTILSLVVAVHHFMHHYKHNPQLLFHHYNLYDWMLCTIHTFKPLSDGTLRTMLNDHNIEKQHKRFMSLSIDAIKNCLYAQM